MTNSLFVYGTLAPGRPNAHVLADVEGTWEPATTKGTLHERGWGADVGFPGIVLEDAVDDVDGLLFTSEWLPEHWDRLDEFEGEGYERVVVPVQVADGRTVDADVYILRDAPLA